MRTGLTPDLARAALAFAAILVALADAGSTRAVPTTAPEGMVLVPGARVTLGHAEIEDRHPFTATIASFYLDRTEVTVEAYTACVRSGRCPAYTPSVHLPGARHTDAQRQWLLAQCTYGAAGRELHPMNCVTYEEARGFCAARGARLPTQDEWEYAARGTDGRSYPWGNETPESGVRANYDDASLRRALEAAGLPTQRAFSGLDDGFASTSPSGALRADESPFGVRDMAGNVMEWTSSVSLYDRSAPRGSRNATCGGSWYSGAMIMFDCSGRALDARFPTLGVRCAHSASRSPASPRRRGRR